MDLTAIKPQKTAARASGKTYPQLPADDTTAAHVDNIISCKEQIETLEASLDQSAGELKSRAATHFLRSCNGTNNVPTAYEVAGSEGRTIQVQVKNRYYPINKASKGAAERIDALKRAAGEAYDKMFRTTFELKIDGDKVPTNTGQRFINSLARLCNLFCYQPSPEEADAHEAGMSDIESILDLHEYAQCDVLTAKEVIAARPSFHTERHAIADAETNLAVNKHMPVSTAIKVKK